jgi:hypothetical protein
MLVMPNKGVNRIHYKLKNILYYNQLYILKKKLTIIMATAQLFISNNAVNHI